MPQDSADRNFPESEFATFAKLVDFGIEVQIWNNQSRVVTMQRALALLTIDERKKLSSVLIGDGAGSQSVEPSQDFGVIMFGGQHHINSRAIGVSHTHEPDDIVKYLREHMDIFPEYFRMKEDLVSDGVILEQNFKNEHIPFNYNLVTPLLRVCRDFSKMTVEFPKEICVTDDNSISLKDGVLTLGIKSNVQELKSCLNGLRVIRLPQGRFHKLQKMLSNRPEVTVLSDNGIYYRNGVPEYLRYKEFEGKNDSLVFLGKEGKEQKIKYVDYKELQAFRGLAPYELRDILEVGATKRYFDMNSSDILSLRYEGMYTRWDEKEIKVLSFYDCTGQKELTFSQTAFSKLKVFKEGNSHYDLTVENCYSWLYDGEPQKGFRFKGILIGNEGEETLYFVDKKGKNIYFPKIAFYSKVDHIEDD